ncbi:Pol polyprotein [Habropoda laboriosa]|nr:Pol polyprotein [Habropoda laboriosa]
MQRRFEVLSIDLFGPLPPSQDDYKWIFIVKDRASRWVELFPLSQATAENCAVVLMEEVFLRYGVPRRIISDNGTQFISKIMQKLLHCLDIKSQFIPVYHPQTNPVERKNRDLKTQLAILVGDQHLTWKENSRPTQQT